MTEEELFNKQFPEYVVNGKPLSPYFDLFENGYEQSENRIEELEAKIKHLTKHLEPQAMSELFEQVEEEVKQEQIIEELKKENAELQHKIDTLQGFLDRDAEFDNLQKENADLHKSYDDLYFSMRTLKEENAELRCECRRCVYSDCPCILSDYGKDKNGICDHFKDVFDENVELKDELKWKDEWQEQVQKATDEGYARTLQTIQLNKAKEIIGKLLSRLNRLTYTGLNCEECKEAEQFLNDNSTYECIQKAKYNYTD